MKQKFLWGISKNFIDSKLKYYNLKQYEIKADRSIYRNVL